MNEATKKNAEGDSPQPCMAGSEMGVQVAVRPLVVGLGEEVAKWSLLYAVRCSAGWAVVTH